MNIKIEVPNFEKILVTFQNLPGKINDNVIAALVDSANDLRNEMIDSMEKSPPTGYKYKVGGKIHTASSPGYPPRRMNGDLIASFDLDIDPIKGTVEVGSNITNPPYPKYLEEGVGSPSEVYFIAARPYMQPAVNKLKPQMEKRVLDALKRSI